MQISTQVIIKQNFGRVKVLGAMGTKGEFGYMVL